MPRRAFHPLFAALVATGIAACSPTIEPHGDLPQAQRLAQIEPGRTKSDVLTLLGTPSSTFNLGVERWYYISNQTEEFAWEKIHEVERLVIAIDFDKSGKVTQVRKLTLKDGQDVAMVDRVTPTTGAGQSLIGQFLGNIGRFSDNETPTR